MVANTLISFINVGSASKEMRRKTNELKDLIRHRMDRLGLKPTIESLRPDVWELKLIAANLMTSSKGLEQLPKLLEEVRSDLLLYNDTYTQPSLHAFEIYHKTVMGIMEQFTEGKNLEKIQIPPDLDMPYETILDLLKLPHWTFRYLADWLYSSLDLDIGFLILLTHREESITIDPDEFIDFLRSAGENFGAYAEVLDLWWIPDEDETQAIRNTKIVAAALRSHISLSRVSYSAKELKTILAGDEL